MQPSPLLRYLVRRKPPYLPQHLFSNTLSPLSGLVKCFVTSFLRWWFVSTPPNPQSGGPPTAVRDCLFKIFAPAFRIWRPILHPLPEDPPCCGDNCIGVQHMTQLYSMQPKHNCVRV
jgi:hypothetical protein